MNDPKKALHRESYSNREILEESTECGCFHCKKIYDPIEIVEWSGGRNGIGNETAACPYCGMESVIGNASIPICAEMLNDMHYYDSSMSYINARFPAEEQLSLQEYDGLFVPVPPWEKGSSDDYQKKQRQARKVETPEEVTAEIEEEKTGLNKCQSPEERLLLTVFGRHWRKLKLRQSEESRHQDRENLEIVYKIRNGEAVIDQQTADKFNASAWAILLKNRPEYVKMCDIGKMPVAGLKLILIKVPKVAKYLDTSRLTGQEWIHLIKYQPRLRFLAKNRLANQAG